MTDIDIPGCPARVKSDLGFEISKVDLALVHYAVISSFSLPIPLRTIQYNVDFEVGQIRSVVTNNQTKVNPMKSKIFTYYWSMRVKDLAHLVAEGFGKFLGRADDDRGSVVRLLCVGALLRLLVVQLLDAADVVLHAAQTPDLSEGQD